MTQEEPHDPGRHGMNEPAGRLRRLMVAAIEGDEAYEASDLLAAALAEERRRTVDAIRERARDCCDDDFLENLPFDVPGSGNDDPDDLSRASDRTAPTDDSRQPSLPGATPPPALDSPSDHALIEILGFVRSCAAFNRIPVDVRDGVNWAWTELRRRNDPAWMAEYARLSDSEGE